MHMVLAYNGIWRMACIGRHCEVMAKGVKLSVIGLVGGEAVAIVGMCVGSHNMLSYAHSYSNMALAPICI